MRMTAADTNHFARMLLQAARLPSLIALRSAIYSPEFRAFLSEIAGCGPLSDRTDCSSNLYVHNCHLLCHDDVIGTRRGGQGAGLLLGRS